MKFLFSVLILVMFLVLGCTSVPHVSGETRLENERYLVSIPRSYRGEQAKIDYAVNEWVRRQGQTSYDLQIQRRGPFTDYFVTMPGSTPVKDLPEIKHLHRGRTATAIAVPGGIGLFLLLIVSVASML